MKVDRANIGIKIGLSIVLCCLLVSNAFAILVEPVKHEELKSMEKNIADNTLKRSHELSKNVAHPSDFLSQKNFVLVDSMKEDGQLFFEMRREHLLISESSAAALLLLGFFGFFSRRWL